MNEHARDLAQRERGEAARQYVLRQESDADSVRKVNGVAAAAMASVIAERPAEILRLTLDEALMHIDLEDQPALMFRHRDSGRMNVVYRRDDGTFGWIDPAT